MHVDYSDRLYSGERSEWAERLRSFIFGSKQAPRPLLLSWTLLCHDLVSRNAKRNQDSLYQLVSEGFLHGFASCLTIKLYSFDRVCQD